eukprot:CAMPEP_0176340116 /NCGR_PEP_ID=MMETSP0126-20121128/1315_1 /TAXON_ID=141414 ORGANISM="Strombidinopsis acuminatum, Strain SPMC142" /NCGR_SAMPLE_ID=MMETSP0126 /ASSEMBLY_ACC=CAM_ASM_000229 /LENGTH=179 /DNA_ID=CAMNT_0017684129 /DNA_START=727 /DNA_END=1263 /DNA_ORIENTATION=+
MNGTCEAACFSPCEKYLYTVGDEAEIYQWDLNMRKCIGRTGDEGNYSTTSVTVSPDGKLIATGSKMGTVNVFKIDEDSHTIEEGGPIKTLMNLTTSVTDLKFNKTSQLLAYCSKWKKNAFRVAHIPSYTAFKNFPGAAAGVLKYPFVMDFSHTSEFLAMGNDEGKAHLYHLSHFSNKHK